MRSQDQNGDERGEALERILPLLAILGFAEDDAHAVFHFEVEHADGHTHLEAVCVLHERQNVFHLHANLDVGLGAVRLQEDKPLEAKVLVRILVEVRRGGIARSGDELVLLAGRDELLIARLGPEQVVVEHHLDLAVLRDVALAPPGLLVEREHVFVLHDRVGQQLLGHHKLLVRQQLGRVRLPELDLEEGLVETGHGQISEGLFLVELGMLAGGPEDLELRVHGDHELGPAILPDLHLVHQRDHEGHPALEELLEPVLYVLVEHDALLLDRKSEDHPPALVGLVSVPRALPFVVDDPLPLVRVAQGRVLVRLRLGADVEALPLIPALVGLLHPLDLAAVPPAGLQPAEEPGAVVAHVDEAVSEPVLDVGVAVRELLQPRIVVEGALLELVVVQRIEPPGVAAAVLFLVRLVRTRYRTLRKETLRLQRLLGLQEAVAGQDLHDVVLEQLLLLAGGLLDPLDHGELLLGIDVLVVLPVLLRLPGLRQVRDVDDGPRGALLLGLLDVDVLALLVQPGGARLGRRKDRLLGLLMLVLLQLGLVPHGPVRLRFNLLALLLQRLQLLRPVRDVVLGPQIVHLHLHLAVQLLQLLVLVQGALGALGLRLHLLLGLLRQGLLFGLRLHRRAPGHREQGVVGREIRVQRQLLPGGELGGESLVLLLVARQEGLLRLGPVRLGNAGRVLDAVRDPEQQSVALDIDDGDGGADVAGQHLRKERDGPGDRRLQRDLEILALRVHPPLLLQVVDDPHVAEEVPEPQAVREHADRDEAEDDEDQRIQEQPHDAEAHNLLVAGLVEEQRDRLGREDEGGRGPRKADEAIVEDEDPQLRRLQELGALLVPAHHDPVVRHVEGARDDDEQQHQDE
mmetsp:Transcript_3671/g.9878  ORF Transcript_3671/g.9878 Transcript_3671/m.9878 type:complete len:859 (-) Transcript_3671:341-2917(-)